MQVLYHYAAGPALERRLAELADAGLEVAVCGEQDEDRFAALLPETEVIWHCLRPLGAADLDAAPRLRLIQKIGVGVNSIDLEAARARDIAVCNMPGTNSRAVAEQTLGLMLAVLRRLPVFDALVRDGRGWDRDPGIDDGLGELAGRTVGLVGAGSVPRLLAPVLQAMGARVYWTARSERPEAIGEYLPLDELLARADLVSLHLPLTDETRNLLDARRIAAMRSGAILINTARGALVDAAALRAALESGHLAGAGLDVFTEEPPSPDDPLLASERVVLAPHVAWLTRETLERSLRVAVENCRRLERGQPLLHRVV